MACSCFDCRWLTWTTPSTISRWRIAKSSSPTGLGPSLSTSEDSIYTQSWREYSAWKTRKTGAVVMQTQFVFSCDAAYIASIKLSSSIFSNSFMISDQASDPRDHSDFWIMVLGSLTKNDSVFFYFRSLWISRIEEVKRKLEDEEKREEDSVSSGGIGGYGVDTDADNAMQVKIKIELLSR